MTRGASLGYPASVLFFLSSPQMISYSTVGSKVGLLTGNTQVLWIQVGTSPLICSVYPVIYAVFQRRIKFPVLNICGSAQCERSYCSFCFRPTCEEIKYTIYFNTNVPMSGSAPSLGFSLCVR